MEITRSSVPGVGKLHECRTRDGQRFGVLVEPSGRRTLLVYGTSEQGDPDEPMQQIALEPDEADEVAEILHNLSLQDRIAALERRIAALTGTATEP